MSFSHLMKERGLTDQALATRLGVSRPYVSRLRAGDRSPSLLVALKLQEELGLDASFWFEPRSEPIEPGALADAAA